MAKTGIKISELTPATSLVGFYTLGYNLTNGVKTSVKLDLSYVQTAYESAAKAATDAITAAGLANKAAKDADGQMARITTDANTAIANTNTAKNAANAAAIAANAKAALADTAATVADTAAGLATAAAGRIDAAIVNAEKATSAANTAAGTANSAATAANTAKQAANTATGLANTAATNANTAKDAANTAAGKADAAATAANAKAALADTAATVADAAAGLANAAAGKVDAAIVNAEKATSAANTAVGSVNDAKTAATTAATAANTAAGLANSATVAANKAKDAANTAAGTANSAADNANGKATLANNAATSANAAATNANTKAGLADTAATNANTKAAAANTAATNATTEAGKAADAATLANTNAGLADTAANRANTAAAAAEGVVAGIRPDWNETNAGSSNYIANKPALKPVATSGNYNDLSNKPTIPTNNSQLTNGSGFITNTELNAHNTSSIAHSDIRQAISEVDAIARGKSRAKVFDTVAALDAWLAVAANKATLQIGDNFYIKALNVPDYWWDGTAKQPIEAEKVDLTEYYKKSESDNRYATKALATDANDGLLDKNLFNNLCCFSSIYRIKLVSSEADRNPNTVCLEFDNILLGRGFLSYGSCIFPPATTLYAGVMTASDKIELKSAVVPKNVTVTTTLTSLSIANYSIKVTLSSASALSFAGTPEEGWECMIDIKNTSSSAITQPLPNASGWQCEDASLTIAAGKIASISVRYIHNTYVVIAKGN